MENSELGILLKAVIWPFRHKCSSRKQDYYSHYHFKSQRCFNAGAVILLMMTVLAFSCSGPGKERGEFRKGRSGKGNDPRQQTVPVAVVKAELGDIASYYSATATLSGEKEAHILARVSGIVKVLKCEEGDRVSLGQVLLTIENEEYRHRLSLAEAREVDLTSRYNRLQKLHSKKLVSIEEFEGVENDLKASQAEKELARLNLSYTNVKAPFAGTIVSREVNVGQNVNVGTKLFLLSDFNPLLARVHVPAKEFKKLQKNQPVELILESNALRLEGKITLLSPVIDPASGTIKVTIEIQEHPAEVRQGDFAEVRIMTEIRQEKVLVPKIAVLTNLGQKAVFVATNGKAVSTPVETGFENDDYAEIVSGIAAGDLIIVKGQRLLKDEAPIKILDGPDDVKQNEKASPPNAQKKGRRKGPR